MKLVEFPERKRIMKNYEPERKRLFCLLAVTVASAVAMGMIISALKTVSFLAMALVGLIAMVILSAVTISGVRMWLQRIPNGKPRPEDELPRRTVLVVCWRADNFVGLREAMGERPTFWEFENLCCAEVVSGCRIVYLDDLEKEYLATWSERGIVPLLSAKARTQKCCVPIVGDPTGSAEAQPSC